MCDKHNTGALKINNNKRIRVDYCIRPIIKSINKTTNIKTIGCCCGHGVYPTTVIYKNDDGIIKELIYGITIPRIKRFYKTDEDGQYYIPEVIEHLKKKGWKKGNVFKNKEGE